MKRTILVLAVAAGLGGLAMAQVSECGYTTYGNPAVDAALRKIARIDIRSARGLLTQAKAAALAGDTSDAAQDRLMAKSDVQGVCSRKGTRLVWDDLVGRSAPVAPEGPSGYWAPPAPPAKTAGAHWWHENRALLRGAIRELGKANQSLETSGIGFHYTFLVTAAELCSLRERPRRAQADLAAADKLLPFTTLRQRISAARGVCSGDTSGPVCTHALSTLTDSPRGRPLPSRRVAWSPLEIRYDLERTPYRCK
jgi:hypothetical protein